MVSGPSGTDCDKRTGGLNSACAFGFHLCDMITVVPLSMPRLNLLPVRPDKTFLSAYACAERVTCGLLVSIMHELLWGRWEWLVFEGYLLWIARLERCCAVTPLRSLKGDRAG